MHGEALSLGAAELVVAAAPARPLGPRLTHPTLTRSTLTRPTFNQCDAPSVIRLAFFLWLDVQSSRTCFLKMFALKPAGEFGLAVVLCPQKPGVSLVSHPHGETL